MVKKVRGLARGGAATKHTMMMPQPLKPKPQILKSFQTACSIY